MANSSAAHCQAIGSVAIDSKLTLFDAISAYRALV